MDLGIPTKLMPLLLTSMILCSYCNLLIAICREQFSNLSPNTTYYFKVRAVNLVAISTIATFNFTTDSGMRK